MATTPQITERLTPQQFAAKIRAKYPGAYDEIADDELTRRVLAKYPDYSDVVAPAAPAQTPTAEPSLRERINQAIASPDPSENRPWYERAAYGIGRAAMAPINVGRELVMPAETEEEKAASATAQSFGLTPHAGTLMERLVNRPMVETFKGAFEAAEQKRPVAALRKFQAGMLPVAGPMAEGLYEQAVEKGDVAGTLAELGAGAYLGVRGPKAIQRTGQVAQQLAKPPVEFLRTSVPSRLINSIVKTPKKGYRFGKNPGLGVAREGIAAHSEEGLLAGIKARASEIETARNTLLTRAKATPVNVHSAIQRAIGPEINHAMNVGNKAAADALRTLAKDLQKRHKRLMSPAEATALKSELGRATNWTTDSTQAAVNQARRRIYNKLRFEIEFRVPKVGSLNERWGNLLEAEKALEGAIATGERTNILGVGDVVIGTAGGLLGAAAGQPTLGTLGGLALRRAAGSVPVKTGVAKTLSRRLPPP